MLCANPGERSTGRGLSWLALHAVVAMCLVAMAAAAAAQALGVAERASTKALAPVDDEDEGGCEPGWVATFGGANMSNRLAAWRSDGLDPISEAFDGAPLTALVFDDGAGKAIYFGGAFTAAGGMLVNRVVRWDGHEWAGMGEGIANGEVWSLAEFDDGSGPALYAGGSFTRHAASAPHGLARWNGDQWVAMPDGAGVPHSIIARDLIVFDNGDGPKLYVGGWFRSASNLPLNYGVGNWDGAQWSQVDGSPTRVFDLAVFDDGSGDALYAGAIGGVFRLVGQTWTPVGEGPMALTFGLVIADLGDGPRLYATGDRYAHSGEYFQGLFRLDGEQWTFIEPPNGAAVSTVQAFDDGSGPALYAAGYFPEDGDSWSSNRVMRWDGVNWLGTGLFSPNAPVWRMFTIDESLPGVEPSLYAGGYFTDSPAGDAYLARYRGCPPPPCPADLNADGVVDVTDLRTLLLSKGPCPQRGACVGDLDGDGAVTGRDVALLVQAFGVCP